MECDERSPTSPWRCHIHDLGAFTLTSVSTGFATVHPNNTLTINAVEAYPIDKFSADVSTRANVCPCKLTPGCPQRYL
jgi:hypothetical protein